jgi:hypothetical protein
MLFEVRRVRGRRRIGLHSVHILNADEQANRKAHAMAQSSPSRKTVSQTAPHLHVRFAPLIGRKTIIVTINLATTSDAERGF